VNERGVVCRGGARKRAHGEGVDVQRIDRMVFRPVDIVVCHAVDDRLGPDRGHRLRDGAVVGHVEIRVTERLYVVSG
jgi:hypothetical protein